MCECKVNMVSPTVVRIMYINSSLDSFPNKYGNFLQIFIK